MEKILNWISKTKTGEIIDFIDDIIKIHEEEITTESSGNLIINKGLIEIQDKEKEIIVIGDIHGDLDTLIEIMKREAIIDKLENKKVYVVFLGDYIDRGVKSFETLMLALKLKEKYSDHIILLRGNHEGPNDLIAHPHTLPYELYHKFEDEATLIYLKFRQLFNVMPHTAKTKQGIIMLHGGVPTEAKSINDVALARELHPQKPHLTEILWNDPDESGIQGAYPSPRGAGKIFGIDCTLKFLEIMKGEIILRGHEATLKGYKISHNGKIITLFSRIGPPYWNKSAAYIYCHLDTPPEKIINAIRIIP
ncbi:MAG: serine/threonine protein phosphatase [archaeon GB-1867-035]|nr:serine/threonine protein phosphatase [Candidatus Culexmicrobium profundum]